MNFITKTIKSNYLKESFEVSCWEMAQGGRTLTIVEHAAFEDIIFNKMKNVKDFSYDLEPIANMASYPVIKCIMRDGTGRTIIAIGEAHPDSLVNGISKQNPVIMAGNRAFDRAAIRYLNLEGKVYSSEEISSEEKPQVSTGDSISATTSVVDATDAVTEATEDVVDSSEVVVEEAPEVVVEETPEAPESDVGALVINFGKYRGKNKTVAEIWQTDESWADYMITTTLDNCGDVTKKQIQALKDYRDIKAL